MENSKSTGSVSPIGEHFRGSNPTPRTIENVLTVSSLGAGCLKLLEGLSPLCVVVALSSFPVDHSAAPGTLPGV